MHSILTSNVKNGTNSTMKQNIKKKKKSNNKNDKERKKRKKINQLKIEKSKGKQKRKTSSLDQTMAEPCTKLSKGEKRRGAIVTWLRQWNNVRFL